MTKERLALLEFKYMIYKRMAANKELYKFKYVNDHSWYRSVQRENWKWLNIINKKLKEEDKNEK